MICLFWAVFFAIRACRGDEEPRVKWSILLFYVASTVLYADHWLYFSDVESTIGEYSYFFANLTVYPIYYMYLRALTRTRLTWDNYVLFLPAVVILIFFNVPFARVCFAIQVIWVWVRGYYLLISTQKRLDSIYADYRSYLLHPTRHLLILIGITAVASTLLNILGRDVFDGNLLIAIPALIMSVLLYSLGYVAAHTSLPAETVAPQEKEEEKEEEEKARRATTAETDELFAKITTALREQQLFTNPDLTIQDVATAVNSNRTYVSACINRCSNLSFIQLVARYRIEYAKTILIDPKYTTDHEAISSAIILSGCASNKTFYRVFKDLTGLTPLQFRQQNLQK